VTATVSKFRYEAETLDGESVKGEVEASSVSAARNQLAVDGMRVRKIKERKSFTQIEITKSRVPLTEVMNFSRQMATFTRAGVPVLEALATLREDCANKRFAAILLDAEERVQGGAQLSQALAAHRDVFPNYYGPILSSSELTGRMDEAFDQLTDYIKRDLALTRQVRKALIYPCILLAVAIGVCLIIVVFAIPRFASLLRRL
jgi:type IV pilus assembly protein PilC